MKRRKEQGTLPTVLSRGAGDLILQLLEHPAGTINENALNHAKAGALTELIRLGAVTTQRSALALRIDDENGSRYVDLEWNAGKKAYGYFDAFDGFVVPSSELLTTCKLDVGWWLRWFTQHLELVNGGKPLELVPQAAWDIGELWVTKRSKIPIVFVRRLRRFAPEVKLALEGRPGRAGGLLLFSALGRQDRFQLPQRWTPVCINSVLHPAADVWSIDISLLKSPYTSPRPESTQQPIILSSDGRTFTILGETVYLRSPQQQRLARELVEAHTSLERKRISKLLSDCGYLASSLEKALRNTPLLGLLTQHLRKSRGYCWLEL